MRLLKLSFFLFLLLIPLSASAQGISAWETVLYYETAPAGVRSGTIVVLTPNGVTATYGIPAGIYAPAEENARADVAVSPDRRFAVIGFWTGGASQPLPPLTILDLQTGGTSTIAAPVADMDGYALVGFNSAGTQFATSYIGFNDRSNFDIASGLMVVDVLTGTVVSSLTVDQARLALPAAEGVAFLQPGDWTDEGIRFVPNCYACGGTVQSPWYVWNPQADTILQAANAYFSIFGDALELTNELLLIAHNTAYPAGDALGMFPPANVVEYYGDGVPPAPDQAAALQASAPVVYFNPTNLDLSLAHWVLDGNAFLIQGSAAYPDSVVVHRDGRQEVVPLSVNDRFLTGTTDGFLAQQLDGWVTYFQYAGGVWNAINLDQFPAEVSAIDTSPLGSSVTIPFTLLPDSGAQTGVQEPGLAPQQQQQVATCPGALPPRLVPGGIGRVAVGGLANRMRADTSTSANILTLIQPGTTFTVLSGPVCDSTSTIVWWQVDVNGLVGWSAESMDGDYFLEPAG